MATRTQNARSEKSRPKSNKNTGNYGKVKHLIAVASGKGGVGRTTVAANISVAIAQKGAKVGLMDLNLFGPSMNLMFNVRETPRVIDNRTIYPVVIDGLSLISMSMLTDHNSVNLWRTPLATQMVESFIEHVCWGELDYLFFNLPAGMDDVQLTLAQQSPLSGAVIVTTPQEASIIDATKGLWIFEKVAVPVMGIVENMSYFICDNCEKRHYLF
jgi:ATP-binding protein involved in chromosome partitioning